MLNASMAALAAARAKVADLEDRFETAVETANNSASRRRQLEGEIAALANKAEDRHAAVICGRETMQAVEHLRQAQRAIERELAGHVTEERLCRTVIERLDRELAAARGRLSKALEHAAREQWESLEHSMRGDAKLRAMLVEVYCLAAACLMPSNGGSGGAANWEGLLSDVFPVPTDEEFAAGIEAACRQLATDE